MEKDKMEMVSYLVYESSQTRSDRIIHKLIVALLVSVALLFVSNALWLWAWTSYEYLGEEVNVSTRDGVTSFVGNDGVINNGYDNTNP